MIKHILLVFIIILLSGCEFAENVSIIHEELTTRKLGTMTMSPKNQFQKVYEIDYKNKNPKRFDIIEFQNDDEYFTKMISIRVISI